MNQTTMNKKQKTGNRDKPWVDQVVVRAVSPLLHQSARKLRLVARAIRGFDSATALEQLPFIIKRASDPIGKTIRQAVANATNNLKIPEQDFHSMAIEVLEGPSLKRYRAGPRGMAKPLKKRTSRVVVKLYVEGGINKKK